MDGLQLHYYLADDSHSMDAILSNKADAEVLGMVLRAAELAGLDIKLEASALKEGGLKQLWSALGKNSSQINTILVVVALVLTRVPPPSDPKQDALNQELTELSIEEKKLQIEKLKTELGKENDEDIDYRGLTDTLEKDAKVIVRRSNYFSTILKEKKISELGVVVVARDQPDQERVVERIQFPHFILHSMTLKPLTIENAEIELVSPVLKEGRYRWKGIFEEELIGFEMQDSDFRAQVLNEEMTFQHGTWIECVLSISRKLDEAGEVVVTGYAVKIVIKKHDDRQSVLTSSGKKYLYATKMHDSQRDLLDGHE